MAAVPEREIVRAENPQIVVPEFRRNQYTPNATLKAKVIQAIPHAHTQLCKKFTLSLVDLKNLTLTMQVSSVLHTIHTVLKQGANPRGAGRMGTKVTGGYSIHKDAEVKTLTMEDAHNLVKAVFKAYGLEYTYNEKPPEWFGMAAPYITFMSNFKHRMDEIRTGVSRFPVGKKADGTIQMNELSEYGLNATHHIHCEAITYPPHKRSLIAQSTGPLTQAIMHILSRNQPAFASKWEKALVRSLAHLPYAKELVQLLKMQNVTANQAYLTLLGDTLTTTSSRADVKAYLPYSVYAAGLADETLTLLYADPTSPTQGGTPAYSVVEIQTVASWNHSA